MDGVHFDAFCENIAIHGVRYPVTLYEDKILDGRNRYRAALKAGQNYPTENYIGDDPIGFIMSSNLHRRHLNESQRAMVAARLANLKPGRPSKEKTSVDAITIEQAAAVLNIGSASVERAKVVLERGVPELRKIVEDGDVSVSSAAELSRLSATQQKTVIANGPAEIREVARVIREADRDAVREVEEDDRRENGAPSVHEAGRQASLDGLDYFPTHPVATRAVVKLLMQRGWLKHGDQVRDPGCGEGHITGVLQEFGPFHLLGTDIHDYMDNGRDAPGWEGQADYLADGNFSCDWTITNPPFEDKWIEFALRALKWSRKGVAIFAQTRYLGGVGRYEKLFLPHPPLVCQFSERIHLYEGKFVPDGGTRTEYMWLVFPKLAVTDHTGIFWFPPGQIEALSKASDRIRFTARPVLPFNPQDQYAADVSDAEHHGDQRGELGVAETAPGRQAGAPAPSMRNGGSGDNPGSPEPGPTEGPIGEGETPFSRLGFDKPGFADQSRRGQ